MELKTLLVTALSLLIVWAPVAPEPATIGKMSAKGHAEINGAAAPAEATVFAGDRISTQKQAAVGVSLRGGNQVFLPSLSVARLDRAGEQVTVALEQGALAVINRSAQPVIIQAHGVRIQAAAAGRAIYEVAVHGDTLKVMARKGTAIVSASNRTLEVKEGTTMDAKVPQGPMDPGALSPLWTVVIVTSAALGITGFVLGIQALQRDKPEDCVVVSPNQISCP